MGGRTSETCWAVNKRQDNKLENCCIWLVIYLNCTMMHGLTNLKSPHTYCCNTHPNIIFPLLYNLSRFALPCLEAEVGLMIQVFFYDVMSLLIGSRSFEGTVTHLRKNWHICSFISNKIPVSAFLLTLHVKQNVEEVITFRFFNPLNAELNPFCYLLAGIIRSSPFSPR